MPQLALLRFMTMSPIDTTTLINWIVAGAVGFLFGTISSWVTYRYERKRDDIAWERDKKKLQQQYDNDFNLLEKQFEQRLKEIEEEIKKKSDEEQNNKRRQLLTGGIIPPANIESAVRKAALFDEPLLIPRERRFYSFPGDEQTCLEADNRPKGWLIVKNSPFLQQGLIIRVRSGDIFGHSTKANIVINDDKISGIHARIKVIENDFYLIDLGSINGTWVNGNNITEETIIKQDDEIMIGNTIFVMKTITFDSTHPAPFLNIDNHITRELFCPEHGPCSSEFSTCPYCDKTLLNNRTLD